MADHYGETVNATLLAFIGELTGVNLDVGCGTGSWGDELRSIGAEQLIGLEPSRDAAIAATRYDRIISAPLETAELPMVDVVIAADVLEHLCDPWKALILLRRSCRVGGRLIVSVPNVQFAKAILTIVRGDFPDDDGGFWDRTHLHWFTLSSLSRALLRAGWNLERHQYVLGTGVRDRLSKASLRKFDRYLGHQLYIAATAFEVSTAS